ncbi:hypothetical protein GCM10027589_52150 [Actinocorallia lasiicapitis]
MPRRRGPRRMPQRPRNRSGPAMPQGPVSKLLPKPPDDKEKYSYVDRNMPILIIGSLVTFACLAITQFQLAVNRPWVWAFVPFMIFTIIYYVASYALNLFTKGFDLAAHKRLVNEWRPARYPSVDIFLPVCGENLEVLHNTWMNVQKLAEHYPGKVVPFVLDDGDSADLKAMAEDFGFKYGVRPNRGWFKKAGNMRFGFENSDGDFILILDADFTPRHDLLNEVIPHLDTNPQIGIVQTPQFFRVLDEQTWVERGAAAVQEYFYRLVQVSRDRTGGAICVGTCAVYRRSALDKIGGITLIEHSEDIHTGFDLNKLGYILRYVPVALATGVCPDNMSAFYNQQYRWCQGSVDLLTSKKFREMKMTKWVRASFLSGLLYYAHTAIFVVIGPLTPILMLALDPALFQLDKMYWVLPGVIFSTVIFPMWHRVPYRLEAWSVAVIYSWTHLFTFYDVIRGREMGWKPTGSGGAKKSKVRRMWWALLGWSLPTALVWVGLSAYQMFHYEPKDLALVMGLGLLNLFIVVRACVSPTEHDAEEVIAQQEDTPAFAA